MIRLLTRSLLLAALLLAAPTARAGSRSSADPAKAKLEEGMKLFSEKRYDEAIVVLRQGYAISNKPEFLYAMGQVERIRGNCQGAMLLYRSFLDSKPPASQADAAALQIERCEKLVKAQQKPEPVPKVEVEKPEPKPEVKSEPKPEPKPKPAVSLAPSPATAPAAGGLTAPAPSDAAQQVERRAWYRDGVGDALLGTGVVALGGGGVLFMMGRSTASSAGQSVDNFAKARQNTWQQPAGVALMGGGGALIAGSIVRYLIAGHSSGPSLGAAPTAGGGAVVLSGSTP